MYPQRMINVEVRERPEISTVPAVHAAITEAEEELGEQGRVLVRYSGTQPFCRVMAEGPTQETTDEIVNRIVEVVKRTIGKEDAPSEPPR